MREVAPGGSLQDQRSDIGGVSTLNIMPALILIRTLPFTIATRGTCFTTSPSRLWWLEDERITAFGLINIFI